MTKLSVLRFYLRNENKYKIEFTNYLRYLSGEPGGAIVLFSGINFILQFEYYDVWNR